MTVLVEILPARFRRTILLTLVCECPTNVRMHRCDIQNNMLAGENVSPSQRLPKLTYPKTQQLN